MNLEKVIFGAFVIFSFTLNFGFFVGDIADPALHSEYALAATLVVNLVTMTLKFGDRTLLGAIHLATSVVAVLQLVAAALLWFLATSVVGLPAKGAVIANVVSLAGGALAANVISVVLLIGETLRRTH